MFRLRDTDEEQSPSIASREIRGCVSATPQEEAITRDARDEEFKLFYGLTPFKSPTGNYTRYCTQ